MIDQKVADQIKADLQDIQVCDLDGSFLDRCCELAEAALGLIQALESDNREYRGTINILADRLARYTGRTVPKEIAEAELAED